MSAIQPKTWGRVFTGKAVWDDIFKFCVALKNLKISGCALRRCCLSEDRKLESLHFSNCTGHDKHFTRIISSFEDLKRIVIECCYDGFAGGFLTRQYPALEEITIRRIGIVLQLDFHLPPFIRSHAHLKKIDFSFFTFNENTLRCIAEHSNNVESLSVYLHGLEFEPIWRDLIRFNLRELNFAVVSPETGVVQFIEALAEKNELHTLGVAGEVSISFTSKLYAAISKLTNLKTLKLVNHFKRGIEVSDLGIIWEKLELEHLHLISCEDLEYEHCISAIAKMKSLKSLTFVPCFHRNRDRLDDVLPRWINARKSANSGAPLKIFLSTDGLDLVPKKFAYSEHNENAISIQWKHGVNKYDYLGNSLYQDVL